MRRYALYRVPVLVTYFFSLLTRPEYSQYHLDLRKACNSISSTDKERVFVFAMTFLDVILASGK